MTTWHGYPIDRDAYPPRPWWRRVTRPGWSTDRGSARTVAWVRTDGRRTDELDEARAPDDPMWTDHIDHADPLPPPGKLVGQVWRWDSGFAAMVQATDPTGMEDPAGKMRPGIVWPCAVPMACEFGDYVVAWTDAENWPPPGAVLVAGPLSPWAPMEDR